MADDNLPRPRNAVWAQWMLDWDRSMRAANLSPNTRYIYQLAAAQLADFLDDYAADLEAPPGTAKAAADPLDTKRAHVEEFLAWMTRTRSASSALNKYKGLQQFFKYLVDDEEEMDRSPLDKIRQPKQTRKPVPVLADGQLVSLLQAVEGKDFRSRRDTALVRLYLDAGARLSEVVNLSLDDLDLALDVARVVGKGDKHRNVPFGAKTGQALSRYLRARAKHLNGRPSTALWLSTRGAGPLTVSAVKTVFRRRGVEAGIDGLHAHLLRHKAAHDWLAAGGGETDLMRLMGWSSREMLRIYAESAADDRAHAAHKRMALADRL